MPHGITQCYLPPGRGDIPALTPADAGTRLSDPGGMQGWVDRSIAVRKANTPHRSLRELTCHMESQRWQARPSTRESGKLTHVRPYYPVKTIIRGYESLSSYKAHGQLTVFEIVFMYMYVTSLSCILSCRNKRILIDWLIDWSFPFTVHW